MKKGFTLVELLVTLAIITMITGVSVTSFKSYKQRTYFDNAVSTIHGEVMKAQSLSLAPSENCVSQYIFASTSQTTYEVRARYDTDCDPNKDTDKRLDSGSVQGVKMSPNQIEIPFNVKGGGSGGGMVTIKDDQNKFPQKNIVVSPTGLIELK